MLPHFQEATDYLRSLQYDCELIPDGNIHRFGRNGSKDSAWFIAWQNTTTRTQEPYLVVQFGDFREGKLVHTFTPKGVKLSKGDRAEIDDRIQASRKKQAEEKTARHASAADKAEKIWANKADLTVTEYMRRKQIDKHYGTRSWNGTLQVPVRDVNGKLTGIQYIGEQKRFLTGTQIDRCFHVIGEAVNDGSDAILCEGYATGASLHIASGKTVICAFNAGNLVPVAKVLRERYPSIILTVCGDDDLWTEINGVLTNTGRNAATSAATVTHSPVMFPVFADLDGRPTDFNDLHVREGIDVVRAQLQHVPDEFDGFIPLGHDEGVYFFYNLKAKDIIRLSSFSVVEMLKLASKNYWLETYARPLKADDIDWQSAIDALIQQSQEVGRFNPLRIRGTGVWMDEKRVVVNTGMNLIVDGVKMGLLGLRHSSNAIYIQSRNNMPDIHTQPADKEAGRMLLTTLRMFKWADGQDRGAVLLAGWLACARIAAALPIRPHVWISGGSGTGKSTLMDRLIANALGSPTGKLYLQGGSTEAGIRQAIRASSVPVIFDEFEVSDSHTSRDRNDAVIELLRNSWSASKGAMVKGSASGQTMQYQLSFSALVSSIRQNLSNDADRSRFTILELAPHGDDAEHWKELEEMLQEITEDFGERLFARMITMVETVKRSASIFGSALAVRKNQRAGQQIGMLLAGYWALDFDDVVTTSEAAFVVDLLFPKEEETVPVPDHLECLNHLLLQPIDVVNDQGFRDRLSIAEIITSGSLSQQRALCTFGVKLSGAMLQVADAHPELQRIFGGTRWNRNWNVSFRRIEGAKSGRMYLSKYQAAQRATFIPMSVVQSEEAKAENGNDSMPR